MFAKRKRGLQVLCGLGTGDKCWTQGAPARTARIPLNSQLCNAELQHRSLSFSRLCYLEGHPGKKYDSLWGEVCNARCVRGIRITWEARVASALLTSRPWSQDSRPSMISWALMFLFHCHCHIRAPGVGHSMCPQMFKPTVQKIFTGTGFSQLPTHFIFYFPWDLSLCPLWLVTL